MAFAGSCLQVRGQQALVLEGSQAGPWGGGWCEFLLGVCWSQWSRSRLGGPRLMAAGLPTAPSRFLYSDEVQIGPETVMTTLYTAKKYAVPALEAHCVEFLKKNLRADNAFMLLTQVRAAVRAAVRDTG